MGLRHVRWIALASAFALGIMAGCGSDDEEASPGGGGGQAGNGQDGGALGGNGGSGGGTAGSAGQAGTGYGGTGNGGAAGQGGSSNGGSAGQAGGAMGGSAGQAGSATGGSSGQAGSSSAGGVIVPLYSYPTDATWDTIAAAKTAHPTVDLRAIINPDSGPGASVDTEFTSGIAKLTAAGIVVLGYVSTSYASREASEVQADVEAYRSWYPGLTGIFFDEMQSTAGDEAYYAGLSQFAKGIGFTSTVGNPGTDVDESYVGTVDTMFIYESSGLPEIGTLGGWHLNHDRRNFGIIPYAVSSLDTSFVSNARSMVGYIYITDDDLPNPWDTLPAYFDDLMGALE